LRIFLIGHPGVQSALTGLQQMNKIAGKSFSAICRDFAVDPVFGQVGDRYPEFIGNIPMLCS